MPDLPDTVIGGQLKVGTGLCPAIGEGLTKINGSAGVEGPALVGAPLSFPMTMGTLFMSISWAPPFPRLHSSKT